MNIDLNEENYDYEKLLELFSLEPDFDEKDLKLAKIKVLKLHPDRSHLDVKYFHFFRKMYFKVEEIYNFTKHETDENNLTKQYDVETHFRDYLESNNINPKTNFKAFSREFNKMFEKVYINEDSDNGHGKWLKSNENMYDKDDIEKSRTMAMNQIIKKENNIEEYGYFQKQSLQLYDVKESHTNSIVVMDTEKVYNEKPKFSSVHEYKQHLANEDRQNKPLSIDQSNMYLQEKESLLNNQSKKMAFEHMERKQKMDNNYKDYVHNFLKLTR
jgi:hypothetical protein